MNPIPSPRPWSRKGGISVPIQRGEDAQFSVPTHLKNRSWAGSRGFLKAHAFITRDAAFVRSGSSFHNVRGDQPYRSYERALPHNSQMTERHLIK